MSKNILQIGDQAPGFCLPDQEGNETCLADFQGKWVVIYFYPKDNTPGCTVEALDFSAAKEDLEAKKAVILGISPDSAQSHRKFVLQHGLTITLLCDPGREVLRNYGAWQLKNMYGKESFGVIRSTYLIDPQGKIAFTWPQVKAKGHVEKVVQKLAELQSNSG